MRDAMAALLDCVTIRMSAILGPLHLAVVWLPGVLILGQGSLEVGDQTLSRPAVIGARAGASLVSKRDVGQPLDHCREQVVWPIPTCRTQAGPQIVEEGGQAHICCDL